MTKRPVMNRITFKAAVTTFEEKLKAQKWGTRGIKIYINLTPIINLLSAYRDPTFFRSLPSTRPTPFASPVYHFNAPARGVPFKLEESSSRPDHSVSTSFQPAIAAPPFVNVPIQLAQQY
ncbi:hypothetical protein RND81_11G070600 [Saponaria officinalis]|uniref:Uncharacterized protein n=1 Tax=Saponaria officinalis TaxID=3572 RepID=A0AAW1HJ40_SAPOF